MDCFLAKNGGGAPLNFKVVGNPQPASSKENTIWVNTDVPIGMWHFDASQPDDLQEGDVWFSVGTSSPVEFNALKKNGIQVYPKGARQMIGGALVEKRAALYQGGAWKDLIQYLYKPGDECVDITGGWSAFNSQTDAYSLGLYTEGSDGITLQLNGGQKIVSTGPEYMIDLTNVNTIIFNLTEAASVASRGFYVSPLRGLGANDAAVAKTTTLVVGENRLDVSAITGKHYVYFALYRWESSSEKLTFSEVRVE